MDTGSKQSKSPASLKPLLTSAGLLLICLYIDIMYLTHKGLMMLNFRSTGLVSVSPFICEHTCSAYHSLTYLTENPFLLS